MLHEIQPTIAHGRFNTLVIVLSSTVLENLSHSRHITVHEYVPNLLLILPPEDSQYSIIHEI
jgi:hypothetical protein